MRLDWTLTDVYVVALVTIGLLSLLAALVAELVWLIKEESC